MSGNALRLIVCGALLGVSCPSPALAQEAADHDVISMTFVGQSMIRGDVRNDAPSAVQAIDDMVQGDVALTNLEAAIVDDTRPQAPVIGRFLSPPGAMEALESFGFNLLSLANNHSFDLGETGIRNTLDHAQRLGLTHAGTGEKSDAGSRASISGDAQGHGRIDRGGFGTNSGGCARQLADLVVLSHHNHVFGETPFRTVLLSQLPERLEPPEWAKGWAHRVVEAGADIVAMHGAPSMHGIEIYDGKPILYGLGNFIFQVPPSTYWLDEPIAWESVVVHAEFDGRDLRSMSFNPIGMNKIGRGQPDVHDEHANNEFLRTRGLPSPATGLQAHYILERLVDFSKPFGTEIEVNGDTASLKLPTAEVE